MDNSKYGFLHHLADLRVSIFRALCGVFVGMMVAFVFADQLLTWMRRPMEEILGDKAKFVVLMPQEYFFAQMKVAFVFGIFIMSPWVFYQIWRFVAPGLYAHEKKYTAIFVFFAAFFFVGGALFGYHFVFPPMFHFFIGSIPSGVEGAFSIGMCLNFAVYMLLAFGVVFEMPIIVFLLALFEITRIEELQSGRRYVVVFSFVLGAILTPSPDPISQIMMAVPMILLFELGLLAARIIIPKPATAELNARA